MLKSEELELTEQVKRARNLGFEAYCTDCESATFLHEGRCGCGSGRVITPEAWLSPPKPLTMENER